MKMTLSLTAFALAAILVGCGGGGSDTTPVAGGTAGSSSSQAAQGIGFISADNIAGYTVVSQKQPNGINERNIETASYIFDINNKGLIVYTYLDGSQRVMSGTYSIKTVGGAHSIDIQGHYTDDGSAAIDSIVLNDNREVDLRSSAGAYPVVSIVLNGDNGIDESTLISSSSSSNVSSSSSSSSSSGNATTLAVLTPDDLKGYRLTSVEADSGFDKQTITIEFFCDGQFKHDWTHVTEGLSPNTKTITGDEIIVERVTGWAAEAVPRIRWSGIDKFGQSGNDGYIYLVTENDELKVNQSCFNSYDCSGGFYLESITQVDSCN